jgi:hypothetical protein
MIRRGRQKLNEQWPGYGDVQTDERFLANTGRNWPSDGQQWRQRVATFPKPSRVFIGLDSGLDHRLIRDERDKDVALGRALAALPAANQQEFYELYLVNPADARHWAKLPPWKRPIRSGDKDDIQIWKFFTMQRLNMEQAAREAPPWSMASQGAQLPQMFGSIAYLTPEGFKRLVLVMNSYGTSLQYGRELGDVVKKPWEEK